MRPHYHLGVFMMMKATATIKLTEQSREFFRLIKFHEIPEEAQYVCFLEDGDACFIEELKPAPSLFNFPHIAMFQYYTDVEVDLTEE